MQKADMQKADMLKAASYYKHTYVFDRIVFNGAGAGAVTGGVTGGVAVNKLILHIPNPVRELIYQYIGTLSDKVRVIQRAWRRYTACNPYICGYYPHIDTIVKNMYPLENKQLLLRQSNSGFESWCCPYKYMGWGVRKPYFNIVIDLYRMRLLHYGHGDKFQHMKKWCNKIRKDEGFFDWVNGGQVEDGMRE